MYYELILNLSLLVAISVVSGFIAQRWSRDNRTGAIIQGFLFGVAAVFGMMQPLVLGPGIIFDGRSVMLSLCALFFGPWAAIPSVLMTTAYRMWIGGGGTLMGIMVILSSSGIGLIAYFRWKPQVNPPSALMLYMFGIAVHLVMVGLIFTLPDNKVLPALKLIGPPVMLLYPLATILVGKILSDQGASLNYLEKLQTSERKYKELVENANSIILRWNQTGKITFMNEYALNFFGYSQNEIIGRNAVGTIVPACDSTGKDLSQMILDIAAHPERYQTNENENIKKDGTRVWVAWTNKPLKDVTGKYTEILCVGNDISGRKKAENAVRDSRELLSTFIRQSPIYAFIKEVKPTESRVLHASDNYQQMIGVSSSDMLGKTMEELFPAEMAAKITSDDWKVVENGVTLKLDEDFNGRSYTSVKFPIVQGDKTLLAGYTIDLTDRKKAEADREKLEKQLLQSQKMEAIGQLAGGIAHDFNNMLSVINGYSDMLLKKIPASEPAYELIREINRAGARSADLTEQLLAFARKQTIAPKVLDLNDTVVGMLKMLQRLIGENIELLWKPDANPWKVKMDPSQINQLLANLLVNARDAIATTSGRVIIETRKAILDEAFCEMHPDSAPGEYVALSVSDNGCGMGRETIEHIFEPFYTTKKIGQGTGLGLATVFGIVKQNNGFINVYSEPGNGSIFKIYIPRHVPDETEKEEESELPKIIAGTETVLLVEDEEALLKFTKILLGQMGYTVLTANSPGDAIKLAEKHEGYIHILMTDVVMPEMSGRTLSETITKERPGIKSLFMSGYTADIIAHNGILDQGIHFLEKPFTAEGLSAKLRETLTC